MLQIAVTWDGTLLHGQRCATMTHHIAQQAPYLQLAAARNLLRSLAGSMAPAQHGCAQLLASATRQHQPHSVMVLVSWCCRSLTPASDSNLLEAM
jgi:hypothetical protein